MDLLTDPAIIAEINRAWEESRTDNQANRHEEGGYIVLNPDRTLGVERWPRGEKFRMAPPPLSADNCYNGKVVVAAFHTHPNPSIDENGQEWEQGPSQSDRRWHALRNLRGFVISRTLVYEIDVAANISIIGRRDEVLSL